MKSVDCIAARMYGCNIMFKWNNFGYSKSYVDMCWHLKLSVKVYIEEVRLLAPLNSTSVDGLCVTK